MAANSAFTPRKLRDKRDPEKLILEGEVPGNINASEIPFDQRFLVLRSLLKPHKPFFDLEKTFWDTTAYIAKMYSEEDWHNFCDTFSLSENFMRMVKKAEDDDLALLPDPLMLSFSLPLVKQHELCKKLSFDTFSLSTGNLDLNDPIIKIYSALIEGIMRADLPYSQIYLYTGICSDLVKAIKNSTSIKILAIFDSLRPTFVLRCDELLLLNIMVADEDELLQYQSRRMVEFISGTTPAEVAELTKILSTEQNNDK